MEIIKAQRLPALKKAIKPLLHSSAFGVSPIHKGALGACGAPGAVCRGGVEIAGIFPKNGVKTGQRSARGCALRWE